jgi:predicted AAA+ superfamily ATPase
MIQRKRDLERLAQWREKQLIKVITGVRRCGKSTLLSQYIDYLQAEGVRDEQIVFINLEDPRYEELLSHRSLYQYIKARLCKNEFTYVLIDEIQQCPGFERAVDGLFIQEKTDVYITGSNAYLLSGELATLLSGRYIGIDMLPLSFAEYAGFAGPESNSRELFNDYLYYGSFPYVAVLRQEQALLGPYLEGIYNTILIKDVATRENISDIELLERIIKFLCSAIGSPVSAKKINDTINSSGRRISINTVEAYLRSLCRSYIFYKTVRYDIKGRQHLKTLGKYYLVDTGIRNMLLPGPSQDLGHLLENIVYLELLRRFRRVYTGKLDEKEVDFVVDHGSGEFSYYQVAATVLDQNTLKRELDPLQRIKDNHPKYLLTLDEIIPQASYDGIRHLRLIDWLLTG